MMTEASDGEFSEAEVSNFGVINLLNVFYQIRLGISIIHWFTNTCMFIFFCTIADKH